MQFDPRLIWDTVDGADNSVKKKTKRVTGPQEGTQASIQQSQDPKHD
jgi:paraquat-inducible protein A